MCFSVLGTFPMGWNSSFSWAWPELIPGHWEGLLGLVTSLGSSLNARHSPWAFGQLGKAPGPWPGWIQLEKPGEGWTRLLGLSGPWMDTLALTEHSDTHSLQDSWLNPESAVFGDFGTFWALHIFWQFWHILVKLAHLHILQFWQSLAPHWPPKCHRASWGSAVWCKARDRARKVTITAVFRWFAAWAFIAQFSCSFKLDWHHK